MYMKAQIACVSASAYADVHTNAMQCMCVSVWECT